MACFIFIIRGMDGDGMFYRLLTKIIMMNVFYSLIEFI
ncbi:hypothetical protein B194_3914 [Serratia plymuthica A30]|uniref:Uncharacterized protein n=1 Tax=Serratia plymuthica S13 TaxID=1348660 RepID=S4YRU8_SERPL|nr:hypothetical protein M621_18460 [Serratia plymuthica S13]EKF63186.1 hypothetical protein B194_3914 [Serratia plymuthica A30]